MIAGDLRVQAQDDIGGPRAINSSPVLSYWYSKDCNLGSWVNPVRRITRRTETE